MNNTCGTCDYHMGKCNNRDSDLFGIETRDGDSCLDYEPEESMTEDTFRAYMALAPIMSELGIEIEADKNTLYLDGQGIGIACNSTWATIMEAVGWLMVERYNRSFRNLDLSALQREQITRYWKAGGWCNECPGFDKYDCFKLSDECRKR